MNTLQTDAPSNARSVDCEYTLRGHLLRIAIQGHAPSTDEEIAFNKGDLIITFANLYNGYSVGVNHNSTQRRYGLFKNSKVKQIIVPVDMPIK